jgi:tRNA threonylcarbamoyladenosine biosynthesis protein TsaE
MQDSFPTLEALQAEAEAFAARLSPNDDTATLVTLSGELGAGKTSFAQGVARALGVKESVTSPTFVLEKIYRLPETTGRGFSRLVHLDAYRLDGPAVLAPLGFDGIMRDPGKLVLLEWPERVEEALPVPAHALAFTVLADATRAISYAG